MKEQITIIGGGPVGSLLSIFLIKRGYKVKIFEKRPDLRTHEIGAGRSINLALSHRGWTALEKAGLKNEVMRIALPMYGRMVHDIEGKTNFQPYSASGKAIYSISRNDLNKIMLSEAEKLGAELAFNHNCTKIDFAANTVGFRDDQNNYIKITPEICLGTDGAFSELRSEMIQHGSLNYSQEFLDYGYKELQIRHSNLANDALHIWPRKNFMLIALPNLDGSFTFTLFLHLKGEESFEALNNEEKVRDFFNTYFADASRLMPDLAQQFFEHPVGSLVTIQCFPWSKEKGESRYGLLGDAAHAIVPFYGQGMNCGFEDCTELDKILDQYQDWAEVLRVFETQRKPNTDAIAQMAFENFIEMRDLVADKSFLKKKAFESQYIKDHPDWLTRYEMVTFSNIPYAEVLKRASENDLLIKSLMDITS